MFKPISLELYFTLYISIKKIIIVLLFYIAVRNSVMKYRL